MGEQKHPDQNNSLYVCVCVCVCLSLCARARACLPLARAHSLLLSVSVSHTHTCVHTRSLLNKHAHTCTCVLFRLIVGWKRVWTGDKGRDIENHRLLAGDARTRQPVHAVAAAATTTTTTVRDSPLISYTFLTGATRG